MLHQSNRPRKNLCAEPGKANLIDASICARSRDSGAPLLQVDSLLLNTQLGTRSALVSKLPGKELGASSCSVGGWREARNMGSRISWTWTSLLALFSWFGERDYKRRGFNDVLLRWDFLSRQFCAPAGNNVSDRPLRSLRRLFTLFRSETCALMRSCYFLLTFNLKPNTWLFAYSIWNLKSQTAVLINDAANWSLCSSCWGCLESHHGPCLWRAAACTPKCLETNRDTS